MKVSIKFIALVVLAAKTSPYLVSAESRSLRKPSKNAITTPTQFTLTLDDLNYLKRKLSEHDPTVSLPLELEDLTAVLGSMPNPTHHKDEYDIRQGKCIFLLRLADAKTDHVFGYVEHYAEWICGTKRPTSAPTTSDPSPSPSEPPTKESTAAPSKEPSTKPTATPSINPTAPPSTGPTLSPLTGSPSKAPTQVPTLSPNCGADVTEECTLGDDCCNNVELGIVCYTKAKYCWDFNPNNNSCATYPDCFDYGAYPGPPNLFNCSATNQCSQDSECTEGFNPRCYSNFFYTEWCSNSTLPDNGGTCTED